MAYLAYVLLALMGTSTTAASLPRVLDKGAINQPRGGAAPEFSTTALFGDTGGDKASKIATGKKPTHHRRHRRHRHPNAITVKQT